jgi:ferritin-like metal-binding protein YciE
MIDRYIRNTDGKIAELEAILKRYEQTVPAHIREQILGIAGNNNSSSTH